MFSGKTSRIIKRLSLKKHLKIILIKDISITIPATKHYKSIYLEFKRGGTK